MKMKYQSVKEMATRWNVSERSVRNYCALGKIPGAFLTGKTWNIPNNAQKPIRKNQKKNRPQTLLEILQLEKKCKLSGGIYHQIQIDFTYHSNHMEGSCLSHEQTRFIFETNTIDVEGKVVKVDDIIETVNHFRCIDMIIDQANKPITETFIKELHQILKQGTNDARFDWFAIGEYKKVPNIVGNMETTPPKEVPIQMKKLLVEYQNKKDKTLDDLLDFHVRFEQIHPFQDGNGRVGRLLLFKECLKYKIVPFIINDKRKLYYYRGLKNWHDERGYLRDTCLDAQDEFKKHLDYFEIKY